jgi:hypothetical protein
MVFFCVITSFAAYIASAFAVEWHQAVLWGTTIVAGIAMVNLFTSIIAWTDHCVKATKPVVSALMLAASVGYLCGPALLTALMETVGYMSFIYLQLCSVCLMLVLLVTAQYMTASYKILLNSAAANSAEQKMALFKQRVEK